MRPLTLLLILALILACIASAQELLPSASVSTRGLSGYWKMDATVGATNIIDASNNGNTGAMFNGPVLTNDAFRGNAMYFDGTTNFVRVNSGVVSGLPVSTSFWFKLNAASATQFFVSALSSQSTNDCWRVSFITGSVCMRLTFGNVAFYDFTTLTPSASIWYHCCVTVSGNGGTTICYLTPLGGATTSQSLSVGTMLNAPGLITLGSVYSAGNPAAFLAGKMDEVRIWNRVLTAQEVNILCHQ